ncbi:MAG: hypothetical protein CENE_02336 [Candidatus Celerinatantimonas neptuna]|nr:MAG: hypothetical protein CENE_02336 [Candidatus Celerinatantimonas neptuna]
MPRYSKERKAAILKKLLPPHNKTIPEVAAQEHISEATLYNWRSKLRSEGKPVPGSQKNSEQWSAEAKFSTVIVYWLNFSGQQRVIQIPYISGCRKLMSQTGLVIF